MDNITFDFRNICQHNSLCISSNSYENGMIEQLFSMYFYRLTEFEKTVIARRLRLFTREQTAIDMNSSVLDVALAEINGLFKLQGRCHPLLKDFLD